MLVAVLGGGVVWGELSAVRAGCGLCAARHTKRQEGKLNKEYHMPDVTRCFVYRVILRGPYTYATPPEKQPGWNVSPNTSFCSRESHPNNRLWRLMTSARLAATIEDHDR